MAVSVTLFPCVQRGTTWPVGDDQQQATNDGQRLEEVVFHEVSVEAISGYGPPAVQPQIEREQPKAEQHSGKLKERICKKI